MSRFRSEFVPLVKVEGWRSKLNRHIDESRETIAHKYGDTDCALWLASCLLVTTGRDFGEPFRGRYDSPMGAIRRMRAVTGQTTPEGVAEYFLGPPKPVAFARAGDGVAADLNALGVGGEDGHVGLSLGICNGAVSWFVAEVGLVGFRTLDMKLAFNG